MIMCEFVDRMKLAQDKVNKPGGVSGSAERISVLRKRSALRSQLLAGL
jgi:hypothetical protein